MKDEEKDIKIINYSYKKIKYLPKNFFYNYENLEQLNLSNNNIYFIHNNLFYNLKNLRLLDLSYNYINKINKNMFVFLSNLRSLNLSHNKLEEISNYTFYYLIKILSLNLNNNKISYINENAFNNVLSLKSLHIQNNSKNIYIHPRNLHILKNIRYLHISCINKIDEFKKLKVVSLTLIKEINITNLTKLYSIHLKETSIKKIYKKTFSNLPNLHYLNISYNSELQEVDIDLINNCQNITILFINYNPKLSIFNVELDLPNLHDLHLNNNNLFRLKKNMCIKCHSLKTLHLQYNSLENFEINIPKSLNKLYLNNNKINDVKIKKNKLQILDLQNNLITKLYIYKNNLPTINIMNNLLLKNNYDKHYIFVSHNKILYILNSIKKPIFYHSCFEIINNIKKFHSLEIDIQEIFDIIKMCNFPIILKHYFYKLYLLCFIKKNIKNKKQLNKYYFKNIKQIENIVNIHYIHKYIYYNITDIYVRNYIFSFLLSNNS